jgi:hypothetical protein
MRPRTRTQAAATVVFGLAIAYLLIAYFVAPEVRVFRDASRVPDFSSMVTHTEQDRPAIRSECPVLEHNAIEQVIRASAICALGSCRPYHGPRSSVDIGLSVVLPRPRSRGPLSAPCSMREEAGPAYKSRSGAARPNAAWFVSGHRSKMDSDVRPFWPAFGQWTIAVGFEAKTPAR